MPPRLVVDRAHPCSLRHVPTGKETHPEGLVQTNTDRTDEQPASTPRQSRPTRRRPCRRITPGQGPNQMVRRRGLEPRTRGLRGVDVPCSLVPQDTASPVGAGQSTGRGPKRPSGAHQSMAHEHLPSTPTRHHRPSHVACGRSDRVAGSRTVESQNRCPTAPVAAGRMPSDQRKPWSTSTHRSPMDYRRFPGDRLPIAGGV